MLLPSLCSKNIESTPPHGSRGAYVPYCVKCSLYNKQHLRIGEEHFTLLVPYAHSRAYCVK